LTEYLLINVAAAESNTIDDLPVDEHRFVINSERSSNRAPLPTDLASAFVSQKFSPGLGNGRPCKIFLMSTLIIMYMQNFVAVCCRGS